MFIWHKRAICVLLEAYGGTNSCNAVAPGWYLFTCVGGRVFAAIGQISTPITKIIWKDDEVKEEGNRLSSGAHKPKENIAL